MRPWLSPAHALPWRSPSQEDVRARRLEVELPSRSIAFWASASLRVPPLVFRKSLWELPCHPRDHLIARSQIVGHFGQRPVRRMDGDAIPHPHYGIGATTVERSPTSPDAFAHPKHEQPRRDVSAKEGA